MSLQHALDFMDRIAASDSLRNKLMETFISPDEFIKLANWEHFYFSLDEWQDAALQKWEAHITITDGEIAASYGAIPETPGLCTQGFCYSCSLPGCNTVLPRCFTTSCPTPICITQYCAGC